MNRFGWTTALVAGVALLATSCADEGPTEPEPSAPTIQITGVEDGAVYSGPVTIGVAVDQGTYRAELDGGVIYPGTSGHEVSSVGDHELVVEARNGTATASERVSFSIELAGSSELMVRVLSLGANDAGGGGDAILVADSAGSRSFHALVDAGPAGASGEAEGYVAERLAALGVDTLDVLVLTHAHSDHFSGMDEVLRQVHVRRFLYNGQIRSLSYYERVIELARSSADTVIVPDTVHHYGLSISDSVAVLSVLPPLPDYLDQDFQQQEAEDEGGKLNEGSLGVLLRRGGPTGFSMFLAGDGEVEANERWRTEYPAFTGDVDILKVGHHGANNAVFDNGYSGASSWLEHTSPEVAVISSNGTTHPRETALEYLQGRSGLAVYCTHVHGEIRIQVGPGGYETTPARNADAACAAGSEASTDLLGDGSGLSFAEASAY